MDAYKALASSYDRLTSDVDYKALVDFYWEILRREKVSPRTAVDLACGTGSVTELLCKRGLKTRGVDLAVCALDSLDYITEPEDCRQAIFRVYRALNPGGIFIFDVNTPEKLRAMDGQVFLDEDDSVYCVWRGEFSEETNICSYGMDLFQRNGKLWSRSFEEHREYAYSADQLVGWLREAGFTGIAVYGDRRLEPPKAGEQRIYIKARKGIVK